MHYEREQDGLLVSTDRAKLDFRVIHGFLSGCYWSAGISMEQVVRQTEHSLPFGLYHASSQIGFARVLSDFTRFAYLADVFVLDEFQGRGYGRLFMRAVLDHPELKDVRRWVLLTKDAQTFYEQVGFTALPKPHIYMQNVNGRESGRWK